MEQDGEGAGFSAYEFEILRDAFLKSVKQMKVPEEHWAAHARRLFQEMSDGEPDESMIARIISR